jgi:hypothetical protein
MTRVLLALSVLVVCGCAPNIYRVKPDSRMCESLIATECKDEPADPNRIRLCGNAFANLVDFEEEAKRFCDRPTIRNCAVQCCDVDCAPEAPAPAASAPAPAAPAAPPPPPPPPAPEPPPPAAPEAAPAAPAASAATPVAPAAAPPPPPAAPAAPPAK